LAIKSFSMSNSPSMQLSLMAGGVDQQSTLGWPRRETSVCEADIPLRFIPGERDLGASNHLTIR